ncbi:MULTISPECIES: hypothetical protein [Streptomyces]|uniref:hypothetical protein n=1 Tax=Streptomyces TaxID=1883 RepID=UPI0011AB8591|nr:hypothetical protein [Streptomyces venezuelae]
MDTSEPVIGSYPTGPRLPLLTAAEAHRLIELLLYVELLLRFHDDFEKGAAAGQLASELARRLPAE